MDKSIKELKENEMNKIYKENNNRKPFPFGSGFLWNHLVLFFLFLYTMEQLNKKISDEIIQEVFDSWLSITSGINLWN